MVEVAEVKIWGKLMGAVRWDDTQQLASFQFDDKFLKTGWDVAPITMPLRQGNRVYAFPELRKQRNQSNQLEDTFKGLPGLLADVLPDKYGNRLINTWLAKHGRPANSMNPVETLCFMGKRGMGALTFEPARIKEATFSTSLELDNLIDVAQKMLHEREQFLTQLNPEEEKTMIEILKIGTSAGGARPKAIIAFNPKTKEVRSGQTNIDAGFEHWLLKLDGVSGEQFGESSGWGRVEYAYSEMAKACGIEMTDCQLLEENGRAHFMTKRFDRFGNERHHIQTLCGVRHFDFNDMYSYSYEQVFETMRMLRLTYPEAEQMFRRMVFNVIATNYDDHTKNFSFMMKQGERWQLTPAYDVCFAYNPTNFWVSQQTLSVNGKRLNISNQDLMTIAQQNNIKKGAKIIEEVNQVVKTWPQFASRAGVRENLAEYIQGCLNVR